MLLRFTVSFADALGRRLRRKLPEPPREAFEPGISVVILSHGDSAMLEDCLTGANKGLAQIDEPYEVFIVEVRPPLWTEGAVKEGIESAKHDWVYILNDDLMPEPQAIAQLLPWRSDHTFAIGSRIRENGPTTDDDLTVRGTLCAECGAALFRKDLLLRFIETGTYQPFSWEELEWGTRAWRSGFRTVLCPKSLVGRNERDTYRSVFPPREIERIHRRNGFLYQLRNDISGINEDFFRALVQLDRRSLMGLVKPARLFGIVRRRIETWREPFLDLPLEYTQQQYYLQHPATVGRKPVVLIVSPFAILPPSHGGAVRIHRLIEELSSQFRFILLSDEGELYVPADLESCSLASAHLVSDRPVEKPTGEMRIERIRNHSRPLLGAWLKFLEHTEQPQLIQIEYVELCKLVELRGKNPKWILTMHDVLQTGNKELTVEDRYESRFTNQFDGVVACCREDGSMVRHRNINIVPNGADIDTTDYAPSPVAPHILFVGPLRISQNLSAMHEFLERTYPRIRQRIPDVQLSILGGRDALSITKGAECFHQSGITVFEYVDDTRHFFRACALTINPTRLVRGTVLKVIESIAAGRVCVSTRDGARGFLDDAFPGLIIEDTVDGFAERIVDLLLDHDRRHRIEVPPDAKLARYSWRSIAEVQAALYRRQSS